MWISRNLRGLEDHFQDDNAQSFIDINSSSRDIDFEAQDLLRVRPEAQLIPCLIGYRSAFYMGIHPRSSKFKLVVVDRSKD